MPVLRTGVVVVALRPDVSGKWAAPVPSLAEQPQSAVERPLRNPSERRAPAYEIRTVAVRQGMKSLYEDGWRIIGEGRTTIEEVLRNTKDEQTNAFGVVEVETK